MRNCIPPEKVLAIGLYRLAHGGSFENAGIAMNVGKATPREAFTDVVNALYDFRNDFIKFPANKVETRASIETFAELSDLPNVAGAIDGTHIKIKAPKESAVDYFSRYQQHDVAVQGIVDGRKIFMISPLAFLVACMMREFFETRLFTTEQNTGTFSQHQFM